MSKQKVQRLCMFPVGHTDTRRAFFMGNAQVVGVIDKFDEGIANFHTKIN